MNEFHVFKVRHKMKRRRIGGMWSRRRLLIESLEDRNLLATITVDTLLDTVNANDGVTSLREAISSSVAGDTVSLNVRGTIKLQSSNGELDINKPLRIVGPGADVLTISAGHGVDGLPGTGDGFRIFNIDNGNDSSAVIVILDGIRLMGGDVQTSDLAGRGGAIFNKENLRLRDVQISSNYAATQSGAIEGSSYGVLDIQFSTLNDNHALGGVGGAITANGTTTLVNSTVSGNTSSLAGAGLAINTGAGVDLVHVTLHNNVRTDTSAPHDILNLGTLYLANSIATGTIANPSPGNWTTNAYNIIGSNPGLQALSLSGGTTMTHALTQNSAAIDAGGTTAISVTEDQRRAPFQRVVGSTPDLGAYEEQSLAASFFVVNALDDSVNYGNSFVTLREAINNSNGSSGGDEITFAPSVFSTPQTISLFSALPDITRTVTITGPGAELLTLDAGHGSDNIAATGDGYRIFNIDSGLTGATRNIDISGLTLTGGDVSSTFDSGQGGAIRNRETLTLTELSVENNAAIGSGGGLHNLDDAVATILNSTFSGNTSVNASSGAIGSAGVLLTVVNSTLSGNHAKGLGSAVFVALSSAIVLQNVTVAENTSEHVNFPNRDLVVAGAVELNNSIIAGDILLLSGVTPTGNGQNRINVNYPLGPLADNGGPTKTHALLQGSNAIDAGLPTTLTNDQRGAPFLRDDGGGVDIGAYEYQSLAPSFFVVNALGDSVNYGDSFVTLREAIKNSNGSSGGDEITFAPSVFSTPQTISLFSALPDITRTVTITGPGAELLTLDAGHGSDNIAATGDGYRIFNIDSGLTGATRNVDISGLTLTGGDVSSTFDSGRGGAIRNRETLSLTAVSVENNAAFGRGGGLDSQADAIATIINSTFWANTSINSNGGAIGSIGPSMNLINSTLSGNHSNSLGGAVIVSESSTIVLQNATLAENTSDNATYPSSALHVLGAYELNNSIIAGTVTRLIGITPTGNGRNRISVNYNLGPLADNGGPTKTHALLQGSDAIDAGLPTTLTNDQRGAPFLRDDGGGVDIGAYERQSLDPSNFIVTTTVDELNFSNSDVSLREAITNANLSPGANTITFDPIVFTTSQTISIGSQLPTITDHLSITGPGAKLVSIDAGNGATGAVGDGWRLFEINDGNAGIQIDVNVSDLTLTGGDLNSPSNGLGGGAILNYENLTLMRTAIVGNTSNTRAGALDNQSGGIVTITASTIAGNVASTRAGGGIRNDGTMTIVSSTISSNSSALDGGGLSSNGTASLTINDSTFALNSAGTTGNGIAFNNVSAIVNNTIIEGTVSAGGNISGSNNLINGSFNLGPLADNGGPTLTHALLAGSPAIDTGNSIIVAGTDQRGVPFVRDDGTGVDIGAYERQTLASLSLVVDTLDDENDGDYSPGDLSLREAISLANGSVGADTITFTSGLTGAINIGSQLPTISDALTINGPGADLLTIDAGSTTTPLAGDGFRIFNITDSTSNVIDVSISGLTLTGADVPDAPTVGSSAGGAISSSENLSLDRMAIVANRAKFGGGLSGRATITNSTISGNFAGQNGGGISGNVNANNVTISGNTAQQSGGGIVSGGTTSFMVLENSTVTGNTALGSASTSGIWFFNSYGPGTASINNTIVADSLSNAAPMVPLTGSHNLFAGTVTISGSSNLQNTNAMLGPLANNGGPTKTHALLAGSPAIDAGSSSALFDQRGVPRPIDDPVAPGSGPDIGAYELESTLPTIVSVVTNLSFIADANVGTDAFAVTVVFSEPMDSGVTPVLTFNPAASTALANGTGIWSGGNQTYTVTYDIVDTGVDIANVTIDVSGARDIAGNSQVDYTPEIEFSVDTLNPTVAVAFVENALSDSLNASVVNFTLSESTTDFDVGDLTVIGGAISAFNGSGVNYTADFTANDGFAGTASVTVSTGSYTDAAGNLAASGNDSVTIDTRNPTVSSVTASPLSISDSAVGTGMFTVTVVFDEPMDGSVSPGLAFSPDVSTTISNPTTGVWSGQSTMYTVTYDVADVGVDFDSVTIDVTGANDAAGNVQQVYTPEIEFSIDTLNPTVTVEFAADALDSSGTSVVSFTVSETMTGFDVGDVATIGGTLSGFVLNDPFYSAIFTPNVGFEGTARVTAVAGSVSDAAGNFAAETFDTIEVLPSRGFIVDTSTDVVDGDYSPNELSLREAVLLANLIPDDVITFDAAVFTGGSNSLIRLTQGELLITAGLTIDGSLGTEIVITADASSNDVLVPGTYITDVAASLAANASSLDDNFRVVNFSAATGDLTLIGLTVTGGRTTGANDIGGGIRFDSMDGLTLTSSTVSGNSTTGELGLGGGIYAFGDATLDSSTLSGNRTYGNEGIGGGIFARHGDVILTSSTISGNSTSGDFADGGGIAARYGDITLMESTISGNSGSDGGGIFMFRGGLSLSHSTISGNVAEERGGGVFVINYGYDPPLTIESSIVAGNTDNGSGPDLHPDPDSTLTINHSLIGISALTITGNNNQIGSVATPVEPLLGALANNGGPTQTHALLPGSPAINAGDPAFSSPPNFDQRGFARVAGGQIDMGAFEAQETPSLTVTTPNDVIDENDQVTSLREAIGFANDLPGSQTITFDASVFLGDANSLIRLTQGELEITDTLAIDGSTGLNVTITGDALGNDELVLGTLITDVGASVNVQLDNNSRVLNFSSTTGDLTVNGLTVTGGQALDGGGIRFNSDGVLSLISSTISGNSAYQGGGIWNKGTAIVTSSVLSGNSAYQGGGGGIWNLGAMTVTNSTLSGNLGGIGSGGGINNVSGTVTVTSSTLSGNSAFAGGGINNVSGTVTVNNSIVAGSTSGGDLVGTFNGIFNLIEDGSGGLVDTIVGNPLLGPLANSGGPTLTHAISPLSPAFNAGDPAIPFNVGEFDQRGSTPFSRVLFGRIDIGAFESSGFDFGDAPDSYGTLLASEGARHEAVGPTLGATRDGESDAVAPLDGSGDGADDDGVIFGTIQVGQTDASVTVNVQGAAGKLDAWIDFNGDGTFDGLGERIANRALVNVGDNVVLFDVPADAVSGQTLYARFRLSTAGELGPRGLALDGEVEDHTLTINPPDFSRFFADSGQTLANSSDSYSVSLGDLDGDGDLDAFVANAYDDHQVWTNNYGLFTNSQSLVNSLGSQSVSLGDFDGDGDLDAFVANFQGDHQVWTNAGGVFTNSQTLANSSFSTSVSLGDFDGDGDLDAFVANAHGNHQVWTNTNGVFAGSQSLVNSLGGRSVSLGDVDGDGDLDAFVANASGNHQVWTNTNGVFAGSQSLVNSLGGQSVSLGDFDGDGDLDAFVANYQGDHQVWTNTGGVFAGSQTLANSSFSTSVSLGDLDGDGDLDAFIASLRGVHQVWTNVKPDFGDAPDSYGTLLASDGARHDTVGPTLGATRDGESDAVAPLDGSGDGADDDGVVFGTIQVGTAIAGVNIDLQNAASARVDAWIDFDGNGVWDASDRILDNVFVSGGLQTLNFVVPANAVVGDTYARVRVSSAGGLGPKGLALDGEVEDYLVTITKSVVYNLPSGVSNDVNLQLNGSDVEVTDNNNGGVVLFTTPLSSTQSLTINGGTLNDNLNIDFDATTAGGFFSFVGGIAFNGSNGIDKLVVNGTGTSRATYHSNNSTLGDASITTRDGANTSVVAFTGVEPLAVTGMLTFAVDGTLNVGADTLTIESTLMTALDDLTLLDGGTITSASGLALGSGESLIGYGTIDGPFAGQSGSTVLLTGDLTIGDAAAFNGFDTDGILRIANHTLTLLDANQVVLGSLTTLGSSGNTGTITAANGALIDFGNNLTGFGTLDTPNDIALMSLINGSVNGNSLAQPITLPGYYKGIGSLDNVNITGTHSPGFSPAQVVNGSVTYAASATTIIELGGTTEGSSGHDQLIHTGAVTLGGELKVELINGFTPNAGDSFTILTADSGVVGTFATETLPVLPAGLGWDMVYAAGELRLDVIELDETPPTVVAVYASSTRPWNATFIDAVDGGGIGGGNGIGIELTSGLVIPNSGIDFFTIQFSENVIGFDASSVALLGVNTINYSSAIELVDYDPQSHVGTIKLSAAISRDRLRIAVNDSVTDTALNSLNGDPQLSPGAGGIYDLLFNILVGDASGDGTADGGDLPLFGGSFNQSLGSQTFNPNADWNSDGSVDGGDLPFFGMNFNQSLPAGLPAPPFAELSSVAFSAVAVDALFSDIADDVLDDEVTPLDQGLLF